MSCAVCLIILQPASSETPAGVRERNSMKEIIWLPALEVPSVKQIKIEEEYTESFSDRAVNSEAVYISKFHNFYLSAHIQQVLTSFT